jgi:drug/metabolite transporter (DMT)-like permease
VKPRETAALLLLSVVWGAAFLFIRTAVQEVSPLTVVAVRLTIAAIVLVPAALLTRSAMPPRASWPSLLFMATFNNVIPFTLITAAEEHISSSLAATLIGTMPLFVLVVTWLFATEQPTLEKVAGLLIGFIGAVVLIGPDLRDFTNASTLAELAVLAASVSYAASTVVARQYSRGAPLALASGQMVIGALMAVPLALAFDGVPDVGISLKAALALLALGTLSSGLAYIIFFTLVQRVAATKVSIVSYLIPIVATILGWLVYDEAIGVNLFLGLALILVGVMTVNGSIRLLAGRFSGGSLETAKDDRSL